jgi:hypothetical protein
MPYHKNRIDRDKVEQEIIKHAKTIDQLKGLKPGAWLFEIDDVIDLMYFAAVGGWTNCQYQKNPFSRHSSDMGAIQAKRFIKEAFTK